MTPKHPRVREGIDTMSGSAAIAVFCASDAYGSPLHPAFMTEIFNF